MKKQSKNMKDSPHLAYMCGLPLLTEPVTQNRCATSMCETNEITTGKKAQEEGHGSYCHRRLTRIKRETLWPFPHQVTKTNADLLNFKLTQSTSVCQERADELKAQRAKKASIDLALGIWLLSWFQKVLTEKFALTIHGESFPHATYPDVYLSKSKHSRHTL